MRQPAGGGAVRRSDAARGWHLAVISTGALADSALEQRLLQRAAS
jgi:predicted dinucleotide-utilizing enzyme